MNLEKIKNFIQKELQGWKKGEIAFLSAIFLFILINAFLVKDSVVAVVSAICGILYSTLAGKGKISCYFFGLCGTGCYSFLSFQNALWGNLILYLGYYLPMQVTGIFAWKKHLNDKTKEIVKTSLSIKQRIIAFSLAAILCLCAIAIIKFFHGSNPVCDGITTVLSIFGMYFTVKRCIEQWFMWIIVNGLSSIMWLNLVLHGSKTYSTLIMWIVYFILSIYFYICWKKELKKAAD